MRLVNVFYVALQIGCVSWPVFFPGNMYRQTYNQLHSETWILWLAL